VSAYAIDVVVRLKPVVNDPQGLSVRHGLRALGFAEVRQARVGKFIELEVEAASESAARERVVEMCEKLLRNPVIEDYSIEAARAVDEAAAAS
jgi:phosphoribosylformylglycinamidine synthase PurS subunit